MSNAVRQVLSILETIEQQSKLTDDIERAALEIVRLNLLLVKAEKQAEKDKETIRHLRLALGKCTEDSPFLSK